MSGLDASDTFRPCPGCGRSIRNVSTSCTYCGATVPALASGGFAQRRHRGLKGILLVAIILFGVPGCGLGWLAVIAGGESGESISSHPMLWGFFGISLFGGLLYPYLRVKE